MADIDSYTQARYDAKHRANFLCENCGRPERKGSEIVSPLTLVHLDGDKSNRDPDNLLVLCGQCLAVFRAGYVAGQMAIPGMEPRWMKGGKT